MDCSVAEFHWIKRFGAEEEAPHAENMRSTEAQKRNDGLMFKTKSTEP
jgi:hypothetical protein